MLSELITAKNMLLISRIASAKSFLCNVIKLAVCHSATNVLDRLQAMKKPSNMTHDTIMSNVHDAIDVERNSSKFRAENSAQLSVRSIYFPSKLKSNKNFNFLFSLPYMLINQYYSSDFPRQIYVTQTLSNITNARPFSYFNRNKKKIIKKSIHFINFSVANVLLAVHVRVLVMVF